MKESKYSGLIAMFLASLSRTHTSFLSHSYPKPLSSTEAHYQYLKLSQLAIRERSLYSLSVWGDIRSGERAEYKQVQVTIHVVRFHLNFTLLRFRLTLDNQQGLSSHPVLIEALGQSFMASTSSANSLSYACPTLSLWALYSFLSI